MADRTSYRTTWLLCGFIIAGWIWDLALGSGTGHSLAWAAALVLVGGISALATRGARLAAAETGPADNLTAEQEPKPAPDDRTVRPAVPAEFEQLIEVEVAADKLFEVAGYGKTPPPADAVDLAAARLLLAIGDPARGYARVEEVDGQAHLEGLSVRPKFMRQGLGSALVNAACDWAAEQGYQRITLCTFAEVPWNKPFYATLGFTELAELTPGLAALRAHEVEVGLDELGPRVVLVRELG